MNQKVFLLCDEKMSPSAAPSCCLNDASLTEPKKTKLAKGGVQEPTPITYFNVMKRSKTRLKIQHEGRTVLFDSGSSHTIILKKLVEHQSWKRLRNPIGFDSCNGVFDLTHQTEVALIFPELNSHREVTWNCFIDDRPSDDLGYDLIIGRDLMTQLGIELDFNNKCSNGKELN